MAEPGLVPDDADPESGIDLTPGAATSPAPMDSGTRRALGWFTAVVLIVQGVGLFMPGSSSAPEPLYVDKVIHATIFGLPVYLLSLLFGRRWLWAGVFVAYGALSEVIQYYLIPGRDGDVFDFTADVVGIAVAVGVLLWRGEGGQPRR